MQPDALTLNVDYLNDSITTAEAYSRFEQYQNRAVYIGANHTPDARDTVSLYRSFPTKSGNFKGVKKTAVKFSKDQEVSGVDGVSSLSVPMIIEVNFSVPVGTTAAEVLKARQRVIAMLDDDSLMDPLNNQLMV